MKVWRVEEKAFVYHVDDVVLAESRVYSAELAGDLEQMFLTSKQLYYKFRPTPESQSWRRPLSSYHAQCRQKSWNLYNSASNRRHHLCL